MRPEIDKTCELANMLRILLSDTCPSETENSENEFPIFQIDTDGLKWIIGFCQEPKKRAGRRKILQETGKLIN